MTTHTLTLVPLQEIAHKLPRGSRLAEKVKDSAEFNDEIVLHVIGDLRLKALDLEQPLSEISELRAMLGDASDPSNSAFLIFIEGNLQVETCITNENTDGATNLIVCGDVTAHDVAIGGQHFYVQGALTVTNLLWGDYNHGELCVRGATRARIALFSDEYFAELSGGEKFDHLLDETREVPNLIEFSYEWVHGIFEAEVLNPAEQGDTSISQMVDRDALVAALRANISITQTDDAIAVFMPIPNDVLINDALSVENVLACVNSGVIAGDVVATDGWFAQTSFMIVKRSIDEKGDQINDRAFITVWKTLDLYVGVAQVPKVEKEGVWATLKAVLSNRPAPTHEVLQIQCRGYTDGEPNDWTELSEVDEKTRAAAIKAWRGMLDYIRTGIGQARAGYPIAQRLQSEVSHARVAALVGLPVFTQKYNDWWGDENGYWQNEIWVGARQKCEHKGVSYLRAFDLSFENGDEASGDDDNDAIASYKFFETESLAAAFTMNYQQRQSATSELVPRMAAVHQLRLLRYFKGMERLLIGTAQIEEQAHAERQRIVDLVVLLKPPPYDQVTLNTEIFPAELIALSEQWQTQARSHCESIRSIHDRFEALPEDMPDDEDDFVWPVDERKETWPVVLQLARVVSAHANPDLSSRFRELFSFAASAMHDGARNHGQFVGPLFLLDSGRVVARVGAAYDDLAYWALLDGLNCERLPALSGLGRSPNRKCFVSCEDGILITRDGFCGAEIARFSLPTGVEGLPEKLERKTSTSGARCDELIPFNDGLSVLMRNDTGIYLIDSSGVRRMHPQVFDEDGPYTWPKNNSDSDLDLSMVNMALSSDEQFIMVGDQDSEHILLRIDGAVVRTLDPVASYPHHALFSFDGKQVLANSCHLYSGYTSITRLDSDDEEPRDFNTSWRVYASVASPSFVILGNTEGYIHAVDYDGNIVWRHHIGSSMSAVDISDDGNTIIAASYAGYLVRLEKGSGESDPYAIGTSPFAETSRWVFWKDEPEPIHW